MTRKDVKLSETSKSLLENLDLWEELEDKTAEKISGGAIFSFVNRTVFPIDVTLVNGVIKQTTTIQPSSEFGTQTVNIPGTNQITVQFDAIPGAGEEKLVEQNMTSNRRGIFDGDENKIVFSLG